MKNDEDDKSSTFKIENNNENLNGKFTWHLFYCIFVSVTGSTFAVGWFIGLFNTPQKVLKQFINDTYHDRYDAYVPEDTLTTIWAFANGFYSLGGAFGGLFTGLVVTNLGYKRGMILANFIVLLGALAFVLAKPVKSYELLVVGRFLTGFISGFFCGICPLYTSEIPPLNYRGLTGTVNGVAMCVGNLITNIMGLPQLFGTQSLFPYLLGLMVIPAAVHIIGLPFCTESPKYLFITKNRPNEAKEALKKLRGNSNDNLVELEIEQLRVEKQQSSSSQRNNVSYLDLVRKRPLRRALIVSIILQASQQFSGIIVVIFYSTSIFVSIGLDEDSWAMYSAILLAFVEVVMHIVCMFLIDLKGRRFLLIVGMAGMSVSCFCMALTRLFSGDVPWLKYIAVAAAVIYISFYSIGLGPIPLLITSELFDTETRGKAVSVAVFFNWFLNFIVTTTFLYIDDAIGAYSFIIYGVLLVLSILFTHFKVPETKNKSIEEIVRHFEHTEPNQVESSK